MKKLVLVGIDVSAKELVVVLERAGAPLRESSFANDASGHRRLIKSLTKNGFRARVCVEPTGVYHLDLCLALHRTKGVEVMVVSPRAAKDFHRAQLQRSKTDRVDARSLLEFLRRMEFAPWEPPRSEILHLRGLSRRIQALLVNRAQEKNRRHADGAVEDTSPAIRHSIERLIAALEDEMKILSQAALELIHADAQLEKRFAHLTSVKGIANASALEGGCRFEELHPLVGRVEDDDRSPLRSARLPVHVCESPLGSAVALGVADPKKAIFDWWGRWRKLVQGPREDSCLGVWVPG